MVDNPEKLKALYDKLKKLHKPIPGLDVSSIENQLRAIPELDMVMKDKDKTRALLDMELRDLQNMSELLYTGQIIHMEVYEKFQEAASPYDLESYTKKHEIHALMRWLHYKDVNAPDWMKWVIILFVLLIAGAIAYQIFGG
jgi:predicted RNase H-like nuclease (RuvC/YqgF family)